MIQCQCGNKDIGTGVVAGKREIVCQACGAHTENLQDYDDNFKKVKEETDVKKGDKESAGRLREVRNARGKTIKDISEETGIPTRDISKAENGGGMIDENAQAVCDALGANRTYVDTGKGHKFVQRTNSEALKEKAEQSPPGTTFTVEPTGKELEKEADHLSAIASKPVPVIMAVKEAEVYRFESTGYSAKLRFEVVDGKLKHEDTSFSNSLEMAKIEDTGPDEWAFLGLVAQEIKRLEGGTC
jgi:transcriptional regulator with XRE-family HTH domain